MTSQMIRQIVSKAADFSDSFRSEKGSCTKDILNIHFGSLWISPCFRNMSDQIIYPNLKCSVYNKSKAGCTLLKCTVPSIT